MAAKCINTRPKTQRRVNMDVESKMAVKRSVAGLWDPRGGWPGVEKGCLDL